jgi:hypothetical protein
LSEPGVMAVPAAAPGITKPVTESAAARHDIAHPSLQMVARSPSPTTPIVWFPHRSSHCLYTGNLAPSPTLAIGAAVTSSITTATSATALQREIPILIGMMKGRRSKSPSTEVGEFSWSGCTTVKRIRIRKDVAHKMAEGSWVPGWLGGADPATPTKQVVAVAPSLTPPFVPLIGVWVWVWAWAWAWVNS